MKNDNELIVTRTDKANNVIDAFQYGPESLYIEYVTSEGDYYPAMFVGEELKDGLYRLWKVLGWMQMGCYNNEQRMTFLRTGTMA